MKRFIFILMMVGMITPVKAGSFEKTILDFSQGVSNTLFAAAILNGITLFLPPKTHKLWVPPSVYVIGCLGALVFDIARDDYSQKTVELGILTTIVGIVANILYKRRN